MSAETPKPPVIAKKPHAVTAPHGAVRNDEYYWLRDDSRKNPEMLAYLNAENTYADAVLAGSQAAGRTRCTRKSSAASSRTTPRCRIARAATGTTRASKPARTTPIIARRKGGMDAPEEILLDAEPDGRRQGLFQRRRLGSQPGQPAAGLGRGRRRPSPVPAVGQEPDHRRGATPMRSTTSRPTSSGPTTTRPCSTSRRIRSPCSPSASRRMCWARRRRRTELVYEEADDSFYMGISRTRSETSSSASASTARSAPKQRCTPGRRSGRIRRARPAPARCRIRGRPSGRPLGDPHQLGCAELQTDDRWPTTCRWATARDWQDWCRTCDDVFIEGFELFDGFIAIEERSDGLVRLRTLAQ